MSPSVAGVRENGGAAAARLALRSHARHRATSGLHGARQLRTGGHGLANAGRGAAEVTERDPLDPAWDPPCRIGMPSYLVGIALASREVRRIASSSPAAATAPVIRIPDGQSLGRPPLFILMKISPKTVAINDPATIPAGRP